MLIYLYLFSVIVGGVLLASSILLGGHHDADVDASADADLDADLGADLGADLEADVEGELPVEAGAHGSLDKDVGGHGDLSGFLYLFLSLRFWIFFLAFFGLTGLMLDGLGLVSSEWLGLALAIGMGTLTGGTASAVIRKLGSDTTGRVVTSDDYVGKTARVIVPFESQGLGKVRVEIKGTSVDLLATGVDEELYRGKEEVLIVEMDGARARVARVDSREHT